MKRGIGTKHVIQGTRHSVVEGAWWWQTHHLKTPRGQFFVKKSWTTKKKWNIFSKLALPSHQKILFKETEKSKRQNIKKEHINWHILFCVNCFNIYTATIYCGGCVWHFSLSALPTKAGCCGSIYHLTTECCCTWRPRWTGWSLPTLQQTFTLSVYQVTNRQ